MFLLGSIFNSEKRKRDIKIVLKAYKAAYKRFYKPFKTYKKLGLKHYTELEKAYEEETQALKDKYAKLQQSVRSREDLCDKKIAELDNILGTVRAILSQYEHKLYQIRKDQAFTGDDKETILRLQEQLQDLNKLN
jgi:septation ring formation regulator EzrA